MKKSLIATLVAASLLSPVAFAAEPVQLSASQMDGVTAGSFLDLNLAIVTQTITAPVFAAALGGNVGVLSANTNYSDIHQH